MDISTKIAEQLADAARAKRKQTRADKKQRRADKRTLRREVNLMHPSNTFGSKEYKAAQARLYGGKTVIGSLAKGASSGIPGLALGAIAAYKAEIKAIAEAKKIKNRMN